MRALLIWFLLCIIAIGNAVFRETFITPGIGEYGGHVASTIIFCLLIFAVAFLLIRWIGPKTQRDAIKLGLLWLFMTILFEFIAGHYLFGNAWTTLLADYNIVQGRVWICVLCVLFFTPLVTSRFKKLL